MTTATPCDVATMRRRIIAAAEVLTLDELDAIWTRHGLRTEGYATMRDWFRVPRAIRKAYILDVLDTAEGK